MRVDFDEVKSIFDNYLIWVGGKAINWYKKAWSLLEKGGLTTYQNDLEYNNVIIRAYTLAMIYMEFCELAFDEYCDYDFTDWEEHEELNQFKIGQLSIKLLDDDDCIELDDAFKGLVEHERIKVVDCLVKNIGAGGESTVFVYMYLTAMDMNDEDDYGDEDTDYSGEDISEFVRYERDIEIYYGEIVNDITSEKMEAYDWLLQGTYRLRL
jgi:hypothetical protein